MGMRVQYREGKQIQTSSENQTELQQVNVLIPEAKEIHLSCQKVIESFTGEDALLPCVYKGHNHPSETLSIYWRDEEDSAVLNIKNNTADSSSQHQKFRGRVESFPDLYKDGNFSIILKKVQQLDNGTY